MQSEIFEQLRRTHSLETQANGHKHRDKHKLWQALAHLATGWRGKVLYDAEKQVNRHAGQPTGCSK